MYYTRCKVEGGFGALRESDTTFFLKLDGQSRNLNIYVHDAAVGASSDACI